MSDKKSAVSFAGTMSRTEVVDYLQDLASGAREGAIQLELGDEEVVLHPGANVELAVKIRAKKDRRSLRFELSWQDE